MNFEEFWTRGDVHERVNIALKEANLLEKKLEIYIKELAQKIFSQN